MAFLLTDDETKVKVVLTLGNILMTKNLHDTAHLLIFVSQKSKNTAQCLKTSQKVTVNIASEVLEKLKHTVKQ